MSFKKHDKNMINKVFIMESSRANFNQVHKSAIDIFFACFKTVVKCERVSEYFVQYDPIVLKSSDCNFWL